MKKFGYAFWQSQRDALEKMYYEDKLNSNEIGAIYGVRGTTITSNMRRMGFVQRKVGSADRPNAKYNVDSSFFDIIDTEEKAYVLGFVLTDGHVSKNGHLMFGIQANDVDVLEKIRSALNSDHPISVSKEKNKATLTIPSKILCKRLNDMGLTHRKTFDCDIEKILEYVPENLERHFVRGMFDGDGGLGIYKYDYFKKHSFSMMFTGVAKTVGYMHRLFGLHTKIINEGNGIFTVTCKDRKKITELGHYMYDDATIYMNRKYAQFNRAYQIYQTEK